MNTIIGASGQVGSAIVSNLLRSRQPVKAIVRNVKKADELKRSGASVAIADVHDKHALTTVFNDATNVFVLTPESGKEPDVLADTQAILKNYREAITGSHIRKIVALSSMGAQHAKGTGNLQMSYMLEHAFTGLPVKQIFVRPAYYYSNWLAYADTVKTQGILPTFFPPDLPISMISPLDVAALTAGLLADDSDAVNQAIYQLEGPQSYSAHNVAEAFSSVLGSPVTVQQVPRSEWENTLKPLGFSDDGMRNFIEMTEAVINGKATPENTGVIRIKGKTSILEYLQSRLQQ